MKTSRLPEKIVKRLRNEARAWDQTRAAESDRDAARALEKTPVFVMSRVAREPVSVRLDPTDIFLVRRLARRKGVPSAQLLALWVHERVAAETKRRVG